MGLHRLNLYGDNSPYIAAVGRWLTPLLWAGHNAIMIVADERRHEIDAYLRQVPAAEGKRIVISADDCADAWFAEGRLNELAMEAALGRLAADHGIARGDRWVILGEVVDLLWRAGNAPGARAVEAVWERWLAGKKAILYCSYPEASVAGSAGEAIRASHEDMRPRSRGVANEG